MKNYKFGKLLPYNYSEGDYIVIRDITNRKVICTIDYSTDSTLKKSEAEQIGKVLSVAPELLEALQELHKVVMQSNDKVIFDNGKNADVVAKAKQVLNRATGNE